MGQGNAMEGIRLDDTIIKKSIDAILTSPYNLPFVKRYSDFLMEEIGVKDNIVTKCCALGELLNKYDKDESTEVKRIVVEGYFNSLRKEVANA